MPCEQKTKRAGWGSLKGMVARLRVGESIEATATGARSAGTVWSVANRLGFTTTLRAKDTPLGRPRKGAKRGPPQAERVFVLTRIR